MIAVLQHRVETGEAGSVPHAAPPPEPLPPPAPPSPGDTTDELIPPAQVPSLLIVEDNPGDLLLVREALAEAGANYRIIAASRLSEAIEQLHGSAVLPAVVLLDLGLPDASDLEALDRIRRGHPLLPVVVLTGRADHQTALRALESGAEDYLDKSSLDGQVLVRSLKYSSARARWRGQLLEIVERNSDAMTVVDRDGTLLMANSAAEALFGVSRAELVGREFGIPVFSDSAAEIETHTPQGRRSLSMRAAEIEWNRCAAYLVTMHDVTELRRAEELERRLAHADRLASIGQLAAGVAHEVNNPAAAVTVNLSLMKEQFTAARIAAKEAQLDAASLEELAGECLDAMDRIRRIVHDLRTFARLDDEDVEMVNLNDVALAACNIVGVHVKHSARFVKALTDDLPLIAGSASRLGQVVVNLLMNALQAIDSEASDNEIRIGSRTVENGIELTVDDTGCGIEQHQLDRIFEPFFTTKPRDIGTGLGLPLCRSIVEAHGGRISAHAKPRGTRFVVHLPRETGLTVTSVARHSQPPPTAQQVRVLVVDDEPSLLRAFRRVLHGHDVVIASGGREARAVLARDQNFDLILCDLIMPDLDGPGLYEAAKDIAPSLADRFVFISGGSFTPDIQSFVQTTTAEIVSKPIDAEQLRRLAGKYGRPARG